MPLSSSSRFEKYFSQDYYEACDKFRHAVDEHPKMKLFSLKLDLDADGEDANDDLTIDIGLLPRSKQKVLIHISGTHGVEGFPGSAIQTSLLLNSTTAMKMDDNHKDKALPTIVFVHALNPYGFSKLRRFNENNVDLNRNFMTPNQFEEVKAGDPNHVGYVDMMDFINPTKSLETKFKYRWDDFFYPQAFYAIAKNGFYKMKQCLVSGNYHFPKTLFYGGEKMEQSHKLLKEFLLTHLDTKNLDAVGILDVHSGLGKSGFDTIGLSGVGHEKEEASQIFGLSEPGHFHLPEKNHDNDTDTNTDADSDADSDADNALSGYDKVTGLLPEGLTEQVFPSSKKVYSVVQEFGTLPGMLVFKAMRAENAMYHYDGKNRHPKYSQALRDAFYFDKNPEWKNKVITRGQEVFNQLYSHLAQLE